MKKPENDPQAGAQEPVERPRRAARRSSAEEFHIYFLPDGKRGERVRKGSVPLDDDPSDVIEERSEWPAGLYRIEKRKGGEFAKEICFYTKDEGADLLAGELGPEGGGDLPAEFIQPAGASDDDARIVKLVNAVMDARERRERAAQPQPGPLDLLREVEELAERRADRERQMREAVREEIAAMVPKENSAAREPELSDRQRLELAVIKETGAIPAIFKELREAMGSAERVDEPRSWSDKLLDFAKEFVPYIGPVAGPLIGQRLIGILGQVDDASLMQAAGIQPGQTQQPAQQQTPQPAPQQALAAQQQQAAQATTTTAVQQPATVGEESGVVTFESVLEGIIADLQEGSEPDEAIDDIAKLTTSQPQFLPVIAKLIGQPNGQLVQMLGQAKGVDLTHLLDTDDYVDALRDGLKRRIRLPELPPESHAANNGQSTTHAAGVS